MCDMKLQWMCRLPNYDSTQYGMDISSPIYLDTQEEVDVWLNENKYDSRSASVFWTCSAPKQDEIGVPCDDCRNRMTAQVMGASR